MDYFAVMNSGPCSGDGNVQHEVIVGDEDPSLSFASSPSWANTFEDITIKDDLMSVNLADALSGIPGLENDDDNDSDSCNGPEDAIDGTSDCSDELKDSPIESYLNEVENKRKRGISEVEKADEDYSRLLAGCKIIKKECSGYLEGISLETDDELMESYQSDDEQHSLHDEEILDVKRESRSTFRHDSGGSAANSDEENETRLFNTRKVTIALQPKSMAMSHDDYNNQRVKQEISIEDDEEEEGKKINKIQRGTRKLNGYAKPRLSYAQLIAEALMGSEKRRLTLNDIYVKINARHPYYSLGGDRGNIMSPPNWQNAVRHNLTLNKAFVKVPRPANEGRGSFWSLAPDSEKDIFKRLLRQQNLSTVTSTSSSRNVYTHISSSSPTPITLSVPSSKPKQLATVATQTYPASVHFDVSQSPLLSNSLSSHSSSPSPPLPLTKQYVTYQPSNRFAKVPTPNIKVVRSVSGMKSEERSGSSTKIIPISSSRGNTSTTSTKPTIIYVTIPKRHSQKT